MRSNLVLGLVLGLGLVLLPTLAHGARADTPLETVEQEFEAAIRRVRPATVACLPWGAPREQAGFSSGVLVSADGLVLSDGDVGLRERVENGRRVDTWLDQIEVRVPVESGTFRRYRARVLDRDRGADTTLLRIVDPPARELPHVALGRSDDLRSGWYAIALGTAFDEDGRAPPTATAGLVAAFEPREPAAAGGKHAFFYVTTGVNRGVNGGPVVDASGLLIGTVSTWVEPGPDAAHQYLGKVVPVDRIRAVHRGVAGADALATFSRAATGGSARSLEIAFRAAAERVRRSVVSIRALRRAPISPRSPFDRRDAQVQRWQGPFSGVVASSDGWIVTSLYNLANVGSLLEPLWPVPPGAGLEEGLRDVTDLTVFPPDGGTAKARLVGYDRRLGIALIKADLEGGRTLAAPEEAPADAFEAGRLVITVGDPYGSDHRAEPLLTTGVLSRYHPEDAMAPWRGAWQTDAGGIDTNAGGAAVDVEGRLLGLFTVWHPARHGRNSGVAFVVPWARIREALPALRRGAGPSPAFLGVRFARGREARLEDVVPDTAAARAGLRAGDVIVQVDREETGSVEDVVVAIGFRCSGDLVQVTVLRNGVRTILPVRLGVRER